MPTAKEWPYRAKTFEEMSGFTDKELIGRSLYHLVGPDNYFSGPAIIMVIERRMKIRF